uniref:Hyccin n=1 Tax=Araucaria cunninghamii TaxID=56994 RepID=A0A0D6QWS6_ARACU
MAMTPAARAAAAAITSSASTRSLASSTSYTSSCRSQENPMPPWWDSLVKARSAVESLNSIIGPLESLELLLDSEKPARALLDSPQAARLIAERLHHPASGVLSDALCGWLYDTYQSGDADLQLVALRYVPLVAGLYLSRVVAGLYLSQEEEQTQPQQPPLAGFEAVLLALYTTETKARGGRAVVVNIPDLAQASLYHSPRVPAPERFLRTAVGQLSAPLEPQTAVKSTKRAAIVGVALELFYRKIADMPSAAKAEFCEFAQGWAGQHCTCARKLDDEANAAAPSNELRNPCPNGKSLIDEIGKFSIEETSANGSSNAVCSSASSDQAIDDSRAKGTRVPLPMELLQPMLRILGHCLMGPTNPQELKDAAASAVRVLFARASHDLVPEAILATRSLIRLDIAARTAARAAAASADVTASKNSTPVKRKKPEVLLVSK